MRRLLQFRLRTILVLLIVLSAALAAFKHGHDRRRIVTQIRNAGGTVFYNERSNGEPRLWVLPTAADHYAYPNQWSAPAPTWARRLLGNDFFDKVVGVRIWGGDAPIPFDALAQLPPIQLEIYNKTLSVTDADRLRQMPNVRTLWLQDTNLQPQDVRAAFGKQAPRLDCGRMRVYCENELVLPVNEVIGE